MYYGLRSGNIDRLLRAVLRRSADNLQGRVSCRVSLKSQNTNGSRSADPGDAGGTRCRDDNIAHPIVAMNQCNGLAIMTEKVARIHVDQCQLAVVVMQLHRHREDILPAAQVDCNLEGTANLRRSRRRRDLQAH